MAGGLASRFGRLKQIEPVGENQQFIIDYSIFDAVKTGFNKVIFIIHPRNYTLFKTSIEKRIKGRIDVDYAFQTYDEKIRTKPWGTADALYSARKLITQNFALINADDFYGRDSFQKAKSVLQNIQQNTGSLITFKLGNTIYDSQKYKRGLCVLEENKLIQINECEVQKKECCFRCTNLIDSQTTIMPKDTPTSMNFWCLHKSILPLFEEEFEKEFEISKQTNPQAGEIFLPSIITNLISQNKITINTSQSNSKCFGMTYKDDLIYVKKDIKNLTSKGFYPKKLWK